VVGKLCHSPFHFLHWQPTALIEPANDLTQSELITCRPEAVDALGWVPKHALLPAKAFEWEMLDGLLQRAQALVDSQPRRRMGMLAGFGHHGEVIDKVLH